MKAKVLTTAPGGSVGKSADAIARFLECKCDAIPPAYPCDKEAIVFIGIASALHGKILKYLSTMNKASTRNVAFFVSGAGKSSAEKLGEEFKAAGINVSENLFVCKGGLFGAKKDAEKAVAWAKDVCEHLGQ